MFLAAGTKKGDDKCDRADYIEKASKDRRRSTRMPIERAVSYKVRGLRSWTGSRRTVNISSSGVLFTTESPLCVGAVIELTISWPVRLNNVTPLKLVVTRPPDPVRRGAGGHANREI